MPASDNVLVIRPATPADASTLGGLAALLVQTHHAFDAARFIAPDSGTARGYGRWLRSQMDAPDVVVLVAERDGVIIGYAYAAVEGPDWMALRGPAGVLHDILVDPAHRGSGAGRQLLTAAIAALEALGAPRVVLATAARNVAAQRLFARAGFRPTMVEMTRERGGARPSDPSEANQSEPAG